MLLLLLQLLLLQLLLVVPPTSIVHGLPLKSSQQLGLNAISTSPNLDDNDTIPSSSLHNADFLKEYRHGFIFPLDTLTIARLYPSPPSSKHAFLSSINASLHFASSDSEVATLIMHFHLSQHAADDGTSTGSIPVRSHSNYTSRVGLYYRKAWKYVRLFTRPLESNDATSESSIETNPQKIVGYSISYRRANDSESPYSHAFVKSYDIETGLYDLGNQGQLSLVNYEVLINLKVSSDLPKHVNNRPIGKSRRRLTLESTRISSTGTVANGTEEDASARRLASSAASSHLSRRVTSHSAASHLIGSGSVVANWVKPGSVFQMVVTVKANRAYSIHLVHAFDNCPIPIEALSHDDFRSKRYYTDALGTFDNSTSYVYPDVKNGEVNGRLSFSNSSIATFFVNISQFPSNPSAILTKGGKNANPVPNPKITSLGGGGRKGNSCKNDGVWDRGTWHTDKFCSGSTEPPSGFINGKNLCIVGDSHAVRMINLYQMPSVLRQRGGGALSWQFNALEDPSIHKVVVKEYGWQTRTASIYQSFQFCAEGLRDQHNGILVWWFGSHALYLSEREVGHAVSDMARMVTGNVVTESQCVLVVSTPDLFYEIINLKSELTMAKLGGANYSKVLPFYQNSHRVAAQNMAIQRAVRKFSSVMNMHFVDIFPQSLSLHFEGHEAGDAVHYPHEGSFYRYVINEIFAAANQKCGRK